MNSINWSTKAIKQLLKINRPEQVVIKNAAGELATMPQTRNVKALTNHKYQYRLRVGNYRVFFNFDGAVHIVYIEEVRKRDERTY
ncbi:type II toxin-antitoxin system RelE family toxin [Castellaniella sp. S9]|uniref:type II toxin-antitoxin system RelE family toxin n=1 Tax=Castellaniella sp. S9 TaxID=2993652 RepID=UPI0022B3C87E|nr:type II toxin-antitoxin system RelE/ParE family toxin [Castellaniella sp. S9]